MDFRAAAAALPTAPDASPVETPGGSRVGSDRLPHGPPLRTPPAQNQ